MAHTCLCWITYGEVHMGTDPRDNTKYHCLSCGAPAEAVFKIQDEYQAAWTRGEDVEFIRLKMEEDIKEKAMGGQRAFRRNQPLGNPIGNPPVGHLESGLILPRRS